MIKTALCLIVLGAGLTGASVGQTTTAPQSPAQPQTPAAAPQAAATPPMTMNFSPGTLIRAKLEKPVDAKKAQVGDQVLAETTDDLKSVPPGLATKGCKIIGHLVEVSPHRGDTPSKLKIQFDKMILKNGTAMVLPASIKAVGFADQFNPATEVEAINRMGGTPAGAGQPGGTGIAGPPASTTIGAGGGNPNMYGGERMPGGPTGPPGSTDAKLPLNAQGAIGMSGVSLEDSVLISKKHNVKLDNGMQMILKTN